MKSSTEEYVKLQKLYRAQSEKENNVFKEYLAKEKVTVDDPTVDTFLKNAHALKVLKGREWKGINPGSKEVLGEFSSTRFDAILIFLAANKLSIQPKEIATHLALAAVRSLRAKGALPSLEFDSDTNDTTMADALDKEKIKELLTTEAQSFLPLGTELPEEEWDVASGEMRVKFISVLSFFLTTITQCAGPFCRSPYYCSIPRRISCTRNHQDDYKAVCTYICR
jgi:amyloid beta precursor protein binding protein 1